MPSQLQAEFEKLWVTGSPPDVIQFLSSRKDSSSEEFAAVIRLDQQHRWRTASPLKVEQYLAAFPQLQANDDLLLELTAGEFLARLQNDQLPLIDEYIKRFPQLSEQLQKKLSGISTTRNASGTSQRSAFVSNMGLMEIDEICEAFEDVWKDGMERPSIEDYLQAAAEQHRVALLKELLRTELCFRNEQGEKPTLEEYRSRFPANDPLFKAVLADWEQNPDEFLLHDRVSAALLKETVLKPQAMNSSLSGSLTVDGSQKIDHFRLLKEVGHGAFGRVFRAYDEQLERAVAIKIPRRSRFKRAEDAEAYLAEARTVARLEHPQIVSVYQMGRTPDGSVYVVSQLIEGGTLEDLIKNKRPDQRSTATLIAQVARALHYAHQNRLIHRDIKPANILIEERTGKPFVADFGLAMKEEDYIKQVAVAGTPAYMSPEQARAEGHRLDGRSDLFSVGVILYEMLTGKRPFKGSTVYETLHQVISVDPRPPRSIDDTIPAELERICLRAISKRVSDRYATAELLAEDLEAWLQPTTKPALTSKAEVQVVPKGLRSFDAQDADFFLDLLPGTLNRDGLPESIAFWKQRIEETDPERTFNVGLIYGPSGCGKSSLMKAGLLPHLSKDVIAVYLEATPEETELRILRGLRKRMPDMPDDIRLVDALLALRRGVGFQLANELAEVAERRKPSGEGLQPEAVQPEGLRPAASNETASWKLTPQKIVIIIDQFEQWLHAHRSEPEAELVQALRQCDGVRVQAIVMIRDDFAMAAARFMQALDVSILQGQNFATVDLFEIDHAKNVLIKFGQAFGKLPANSENLPADESQFVSDIANGLAQDGKVVSVRLSLFAEMVKSKRWAPETLQAVGGTEGIGVNFLEEAFSSPQANPRHRLHAVAARAVLKSLLPELGTDIKGHMRSQQELLQASGCGDRPTDFNDLLRILDGELRLITPTDPEGDSLSDSSRNSSLATRYYQLTHDYLVPSLREWLTRKQKETCKGRAELKLEERTAMWGVRKESKQLPSLNEWLQIRWRADKARWTNTERDLMRAGAIWHLRNWGTVILAVALIGGTVGYAFHHQNLRSENEQVRVALDSLQKTLGASVQVNIRELKRQRDELVVPELSKRCQAATDSREKLSLAFALASYGQVEASWLVSQIDEITDSDTGNLIAALDAAPNRSLGEIGEAAAVCKNPGLWRRKARLGLAALAIGDAELPVDVCEFEGRTNHELRTLFINEFPRWKWDHRKLVSIVDDSESAALRSAVCLGLGRISAEQIPLDDKMAIEKFVSRWFTLPDSSTHNAVAWLFRQWKLPAPVVDADQQSIAGRHWFVNSQGKTMVLIKPPPLPDPRDNFSRQLSEMQELSGEQLVVPEIRLKRAIAHYQTAAYGLALGDLNQLVTSHPDLGDALFYRTLTLARLKLVKETEASLLEWRAKNLRPVYNDYLGILVPLSLGRIEEANTRLNKAIETANWADQSTYYMLACATALVAQEDSANRQFLIDSAVVLLDMWSNQDETDRLRMRNEPDLRALHKNGRFLAMLGMPQQPFWIASHEVTRAEFESFINDTNYFGPKPENWSIDAHVSPTAEHPFQSMPDEDAPIRYCNWLSAREGRTLYYRSVGKQKRLGRNGSELLLDKWEHDPSASGYRLPFASEWDLACSAGTETEWTTGDDESLLSMYCQMYPSTQAAVCGSLLPNAWGLHDMHGNVSEWCHDLYRNYGGDVWFDVHTVSRGGSWDDLSTKVKAGRNYGRGLPTVYGPNYGFRLALSLPSGVSSAAEQLDAE